MRYSDDRIPNDECPNCLGQKSVFNGTEYEVCPLCKGDGTYNELDDDELYDNIQEEDIIPFDENLHSHYDNTNDDID